MTTNPVTPIPEALTRTITGPLRVLVTGGRDFGDVTAISSALKAVNAQFGIATVIHGAARGADSHCKNWAKYFGIPDESFPAEWDDVSREGAVVRLNKYGNPYDVTAGHYRNTRMLEEGKPDICIAFRGGKGTRDMVKKSIKAGVPVWDVGGWL